MPTKIKLMTVSLLILLGAALFAYCAVLYPTQAATTPQVVVQSMDQPETEAPLLQVCESAESPVQETALSNPEPTPEIPEPESDTPTPPPSKPRPRAAAT